MKYTKELSKVLSGFELYILPRYEDYLEQERKDDEEYGTGITYHDTTEDFYSWVDMRSWVETVELIEEYANELVAIGR